MAVKLTKGQIYSKDGLTYEILGFISPQKLSVKISEPGKEPITEEVKRLDFLAVIDGTKPDAATEPEPEIEVEVGLKFRMTNKSAWTVIKTDEDETVLEEYFTKATQKMNTDELQTLVSEKSVHVTDKF